MLFRPESLKALADNPYITSIWQADVESGEASLSPSAFRRRIDRLNSSQSPRVNSVHTISPTRSYVSFEDETSLASEFVDEAIDLCDPQHSGLMAAVSASPRRSAVAVDISGVDMDTFSELTDREDHANIKDFLEMEPIQEDWEMEEEQQSLMGEASPAFSFSGPAKSESSPFNIIVSNSSPRSEETGSPIVVNDTYLIEEEPEVIVGLGSVEDILDVSPKDSEPLTSNRKASGIVESPRSYHASASRQLSAEISSSPTHRRSSFASLHSEAGDFMSPKDRKVTFADEHKEALEQTEHEVKSPYFLRNRDHAEMPSLVLPEAQEVGQDSSKEILEMFSPVSAVSVRSTRSRTSSASPDRVQQAKRQEGKSGSPKAKKPRLDVESVVKVTKQGNKKKKSKKAGDSSDQRQSNRISRRKSSIAQSK